MASPESSRFRPASPAAARKATADALFEVEQGRDPSLAKRQAKQVRRAAAANTFRAVAEDYFRLEGSQLRTGDARRNDLERLVYPTFGDRPIVEIRRSDIVRLLDQIETGATLGIRGGKVQADRVLAYVRRIMNWHATRSDDFDSPIVRGMARVKAKERARERILTDEEIRAVWRAGDAMEGPYGKYVQFLLLTAARRSEASDIRWSNSGDRLDFAGSSEQDEAGADPSAQYSDDRCPGHRGKTASRRIRLQHRRQKSDQRLHSLQSQF